MGGPAQPAAPLAAEPAAPRASIERGRRPLAQTASPIRKDRMRCGLFSFRCRESYVRDPCFAANIQNTDDVSISASFIAADHDSLFGVKLNQAFEQFAQFSSAQCASVHDNISVGFHIHNYIPNR